MFQKLSLNCLFRLLYSLGYEVHGTLDASETHDVNGYLTPGLDLQLCSYTPYFDTFDTEVVHSQK